MINYFRVVKFSIACFLFANCFSAIAFPHEIYCPTPAEIKNNQFIPWLPLYAENSELASEEDMEIFKQHVDGFVAARWDTTFLESAHCYYRGDDPILQKITFATDASRPLEDPHWSWLSKNNAECVATSTKDCGFAT